MNNQKELNIYNENDELINEIKKYFKNQRCKEKLCFTKRQKKKEYYRENEIEITSNEYASNDAIKQSGVNTPYEDINNKSKVIKKKKNLCWGLEEGILFITFPFLNRKISKKRATDYFKEILKQIQKDLFGAKIFENKKRFFTGSAVYEDGRAGERPHIHCSLKASVKDGAKHPDTLLYKLNDMPLKDIKKLEDKLLNEDNILISEENYEKLLTVYKAINWIYDRIAKTINNCKLNTYVEGFHVEYIYDSLILEKYMNKKVNPKYITQVFIKDGELVGYFENIPYY